MYQTIVNNFVFDVDVDAAQLKGWDESVQITRGTQIVPTTVDGKLVTSICEKAFECTYIEHLELPATIHFIGKEAFRGSSIKSVIFYADEKHSFSRQLKIEQSAFKDCILLEHFSTMQFIDVGYLAFCGCVKLRNGAVSKLYFYLIHPEAFACTQNLKEIHISQNGWLQVNALKNSSITDVYFAEYAKIAEKNIDYFKNKGIFLHVYPESSLMELAYEGIYVEESLPF